MTDNIQNLIQVHRKGHVLLAWLRKSVFGGGQLDN